MCFKDFGKKCLGVIYPPTKARKHKMPDSDSADTAFESNSDTGSDTTEPHVTADVINFNNGDVYDFNWIDEGADPDAPRAGNEPETSNGKYII